MYTLAMSYSVHNKPVSESVAMGIVNSILGPCGTFPGTDPREIFCHYKEPNTQYLHYSKLFLNLFWISGFTKADMASIKLELYVLKTTTLRRKGMEELNTSLKSVSLAEIFM